MFWHKRKYEKCGNTGCISHFLYCALGAKDPPKPAVPIVRCCHSKKEIRAASIAEAVLISVCNLWLSCVSANVLYVLYVTC